MAEVDRTRTMPYPMYGSNLPFVIERAQFLYHGGCAGMHMQLGSCAMSHSDYAATFPGAGSIYSGACRGTRGGPSGAPHQCRGWLCPACGRSSDFGLTCTRRRLHYGCERGDFSMDSSRSEGRDDVRAHGAPRFNMRLISQQEVDHRWRVLEKISSYERKTRVVRGLLEAIVGCNKVNHSSMACQVLRRPAGV